MADNLCNNCGAELVPGARFCRRCGKPSDLLDRPSVAEGTTRVLRTPAEVAAGATRVVDPLPTGPTYLSPSDMSPPQTMPPTGLAVGAGKSNKNLLAMVALVFLFAIVALGSLAFVFFRGSSTRTVAPPAPPIVAKPELPVPPTAPVDVPQPPGQPTTAPSSPDLIYPGATTIMEMNRGTEGSVKQLQSDDSFDKVVKWYTDKMNPQTVRMDDGDAVLVGDKGTVVITKEDGKVHILVKTGLDK